MSYVLVILEDGGERRVELPKGSRKVGRSATEADIVVEHPKVSRRHAIFEVEGGQCRVSDPGWSANGTFLRGVRVGEMAITLVPGDEVVLGNAVRARLEREGGDDGILDQVHFCEECGRTISLATFVDGEVFEARGTFICPECVQKVRMIPQQLIPGYEILAKVGRGGMGTVFKARHLPLDRLVALKVVRADLCMVPGVMKRFHQEARAMARLEHPHIVRLYESDEVGGVSYIAMEFVEGRSLMRVIEEGVLPVGRGLELARQVAMALEYLESSEVIHRDIKPDNVLVTTDGTAKLADFGLGRALDDSGMARLTLKGAAMGTLHYMPPEQLDDASKADHRSDIYALGASLYHALTGSPPYAEKGSREAIMLAKGTEDPVPVRRLRREVPAAVEAVVKRAMARDPARRHARAAELRGAIEALLAGMR